MLAARVAPRVFSAAAMQRAAVRQRAAAQRQLQAARRVQRGQAGTHAQQRPGHADLVSLHQDRWATCS